MTRWGTMTVRQLDRLRKSPQLTPPAALTSQDAQYQNMSGSPLFALSTMNLFAS